MPIALEARGLSKSYRAGVGACLASTRVLRNADLKLYTGEAIGVLGERASGKSTLLLCLAGLLGPDAGTVRWFGDPTLTAAARHVLYHATRTDLMRAGPSDCPHIHLVDVPVIPGISPDLDEWIERRCLAGDSVVVAADARATLPPEMPVLSLSDGRLRRLEGHARVAEGTRFSG
jgi:energy-coupling factor transporter ATP-binding protein EcfA2